MQSTAAPAIQPDATRARAMYDLGHSTVFAARSDPRFSYCTYVPPHIDSARHPMQLVVIMHGTGRAFVEYRDAFAEFARWNDCIVLCPLFPVSPLGDGNRDGFKYMREGNLRYDHVLLAIVAEVSERYGIAFDRFGLFGYSNLPVSE